MRLKEKGVTESAPAVKSFSHFARAVVEMPQNGPLEVCKPDDGRHDPATRACALDVLSDGTQNNVRMIEGVSAPSTASVQGSLRTIKFIGGRNLHRRVQPDLGGQRGHANHWIPARGARLEPSGLKRSVLLQSLAGRIKHLTNGALPYEEDMKKTSLLIAYPALYPHRICE